MYDSVHSARWLAQFQDQDFEFLLFPSSPHRRVHPMLKDLVEKSAVAIYRFAPASRFYGLPLWLADKFLGNALRGSLVKMAILRWKPAVVHALELQNAGYIALRAIRGMKSRSFSFIATNWGSDIYWFRQFPGHSKKLRELLGIATAYSCECQRDVELARELGFTGIVMPVVPNAGGFSSEALSRAVPPLSERKVIALKGYHGWVGRAKIALEALELIQDQIRNYRIEIYSANGTTLRAARKFANRTGITVVSHGKGKLSHSQVLELFSRARIYVGLSLSDGISTSLLEAMAMGAIPVQTSTACCDEWLTNTGVAVGVLDKESVAAAILSGLELSNSQQNADINRATIREKASAEKISQTAKSFYS